jgi:uncharacterized repeat protein (TIGR02543 family)
MVTTYDIIYVLNGGYVSTDAPFSYYGLNLPLVVPDAFGVYVFDGWSVACANGTVVTVPVGFSVLEGTFGDLTLTALWVDGVYAEYAIDYVLEGGSLSVGAPTVYDGSVLPLVVPDAFGLYDFAGWNVVFSNGSSVSGVIGYSIPAGSYGNVTLTATWNIVVHAYNIDYVLGGGVNVAGNPSSYMVGDLPLEIANPYRVGYSFLYWMVLYEDSVEQVLLDSIIPWGVSGDIQLTAYWSYSYAYNIDYVLGGGVNVAGNPSLYTVEELPLVIVDPIWVGYDFLGWLVEFADGRTVGLVRAFSVPEGTVGDIVLTANWIGVSVERSTVTYHGNGYTSGTVPTDSNSPYLSGSQVTVLGQGSLSRTGYTFLGWATNPNVNTPTYTADSIFTIADNVVLYAVWKQTVGYSVSYQPGAHGTFTEQVTSNLSYGDLTPTVPEISGEAGWKFTGWSPAPSTTVTDNAVYVAQWAQELVVVQFVDWDGRLLKSETVPYGGSAFAPPDPYRAGYTFTGWNRGFTNVVINIIVVAQYRLIDSGGSTPSPVAPPSPTITPTPTVGPSSTVTPSHSGNGDEAPLEGWSLVNLVLSGTGIILAILGAIWVMLQNRANISATERSGAIGNAGRQSDSERQRLYRNVLLIMAFIMGVGGLVVFLLTTNLRYPMVLINNWTSLIVIIFIVQTICVALAFRPKKRSAN